MLTSNYINRAARLLDQVGELRPGYLHDGSSPLEGAVEPCHSVGGGKCAQPATKKKFVRVNVTFQVDSSTGEVRAVRK